MRKRPRVLILHALGTNRSDDLAYAFELAGAEASIFPLWQLRAEAINWNAYSILAIPGGFSYGDALGAGTLFAWDLKNYFFDSIQAFMMQRKPIIGICNGFQVLVNLGLLPAVTGDLYRREAALGLNSRGRFECRWVTLKPQSQRCLWTRDLQELIDCPVAHGEGRLWLASQDLYRKMVDQDQIALCYTLSDGRLAEGCYPYSPNGSLGDIAGICNPDGNVLGLMPHPENHVLRYHHPRWTRGIQGRLALRLLEQGVNYVNA